MVADEEKLGKYQSHWGSLSGDNECPHYILLHFIQIIHSC